MIESIKNQTRCSGVTKWIINGEKYAGEQELDRLASLMGCELVENELK